MSKYSDGSKEDIQSILGNDSFYTRNLLNSKDSKDSEDSEIYFKLILTSNKVPTIPVVNENSGYYNYYKTRQQDNLLKMLKIEGNIITNHQELSKGIRSTYHDEMLKEKPDQNKRIMIPVPKIRLAQLDEYNPEWEEQKGEMKRMTGGDNILLQGSAGSMDYQSSKRFELVSSIDENLLNSDRSDSNNNSYTVDELKHFLRQLNLKVSGTKSELVERLLLEKELLNFDVD